MDIFDKRLSDLQDHESRTFYFSPKFQIERDSPIVNYTTVLENLSIHQSTQHNEVSLKNLKSKIANFKTSNLKIVNYLVKEFEMRKSASQYKRAKISRLGQLDSRKLFAYKFKEDIFRQITSVQEGKKHGMIFLLDWSGSMHPYLHETIEQVINLAMFCQKIGIPYQVFAFSDGYTNDLSVKDIKVRNELGIGDTYDFSLLEFFSSKMNTRQFNAMIELLMDDPRHAPKYSINGTPLNHALLYMVDYIGKFIHNNQVEKMTLITLTDGGSNEINNDVNFRLDPNKTRRKIKSGKCDITENGKNITIKARSIIRDDITHKEYDITMDQAQQTATLMNIIKDRYCIQSVGFYIVNARRNEMYQFIKNNIYNIKPQNQYSKSVELALKLRRDKCVVLKDIPGRDELYLLASTIKIEDEENYIDDVTQDMSATAISKKFGKMLTTRKVSRVVLSSFIGMVA